MKKTIWLGLALLAVVAFRLDLMARITGTQPTSADIWCAGPDGAEACLDASGNFVPTTDNDTTSGSSSLQWATVYAYDATLADDLTVADDATITGDLFKTMVATITVTAAGNDPKISVAGACGGILRLTGANADVTSAGFTAPASGNAGCILYVVNVASSGGGTITFVTSATLVAPLQASNNKDIVLGTNDAFIVGQVGAKWLVLGSLVINN